MSHDISFDANGRAEMFCVGDRQSAWHELGQRIERTATWAEAMELAGLNWEVVKQGLFGHVSGAPAEAIPVEAWGIFRKDNGAFLGAVGDRFTPVQNKTFGQFMDSILENMDGAHYESAGALGKGERVWALARIPEMDFQIDGGDKHQAYLMVSQAHNGTQGVIAKITYVRVVCSNTYNWALNDGEKMFKVKHTVNAESRMIRAAEAVKGLGSDAKAIRTKLERMAEFKLTRESAESILNRVFPKSQNVNPKRRENILADVLSVYEINDRGAFPSIAGTAYNLLNAVVEYTDFERGVRRQDGETVEQKRAESALFGSGENLKQKAVEVIYETVAKNSTAPSTLDAVIAATV